MRFFSFFLTLMKCSLRIFIAAAQVSKDLFISSGFIPFVIFFFFIPTFLDGIVVSPRQVFVGTFLVVFFNALEDH